MPTGTEIPCLPLFVFRSVECGTDFDEYIQKNIIKIKIIAKREINTRIVNNTVWFPFVCLRLSCIKGQSEYKRLLIRVWFMFDT